MKRFMALIFLLLVLLALSACGSEKEQDPNLIKLPFSATSFESKHYEEVVEEFTDAGFTNIKTEPIYDLIFGWLTSDGEIESVSIDGETTFKKGDVYSKDSEIIISYHTYESNKPTTEATTTPVPDGHAAVPNSASGYKGKYYEEVIQELQASGFTNIRTEVLYDIITGWLTSDGDVESVTINGDSAFKEGAIFALDAEIVVTYHTWEDNDPGKIHMTMDASDFLGMDKDVAEQKLREMGFISFEYSTQTIYDPERANTVYRVEVEDWIFTYDDFVSGDVYESDAKVRLCYYVYVEPQKPTQPACNYHSSKDFSVAIQGNTGVYAYVSCGTYYDRYWIVDFNEGYAYFFLSGQGNESGEKIRIVSGSLNTAVQLDFYSDGETHTFWLHFEYIGEPDTLIHVDHNGFRNTYTATSLDDALAIKANMNCVDYSPPFESSYDVSGLAYRVNADGKTCTITSVGLCEDSVVTIPETINGYPVIAIDEWAFDSCKTITEVILPDTLVYICDSAFYCCESLSSIVIPDSVQYVGESAFWGCSSLENVTLPADITEICVATFSYCENLKEIIIPESVTVIGSCAFDSCVSLKTIVLPPKVTMIGGAAFAGCVNLESISIPRGVTEIVTFAFYGCNELTIINFAGTMEEWEEITKGDDWDYDTPSYTVCCSDGAITK